MIQISMNCMMNFCYFAVFYRNMNLMYASKQFIFSFQKQLYQNQRTNRDETRRYGIDSSNRRNANLPTLTGETFQTLSHAMKSSIQIPITTTKDAVKLQMNLSLKLKRQTLQLLVRLWLGVEMQSFGQFAYCRAQLSPPTLITELARSRRKFRDASVLN